MTRSKLSIITINLNNKAGLDQTIKSVISQTINDYEYIVIDGASIDGSVELIQQYASHINYWISEPDKGIYDAMNKGIGKASGDYLLFLNSGDWFVSNSILRDSFEMGMDEDIIYGNLIKVYPDGKMIKDRGPQRSKLSLGDMYFGTINHSSSFIKKRLFDKYGLYNEGYQIVSDWAFYLKVIGLEGVPVKYINLDIIYFDMTGLSNRQRALRNKERETELKKTIPDNLRRDYEKMLTMFPKVKIYDKIRSQTLLWQLIRVYNKIFGRPLW